MSKTNEKTPYKLEYMHEEIMRIILFNGFLVTIFAFIINIIDKRPLISILGPLFIAGVLLTLFLYLKTHPLKNWLRYSLIISLCFILFPIQWLSSRGATGTIPYYAFLFLGILIFFVDRLLDKILISLFFVQIFSLIAFEAYYPDYFSGFTDKVLAVRVVFFHYLITSLGLTLILASVYRYLKRLQKRLYELTVVDDLTQVYNRRYLIEKLNEQINQSGREESEFNLVFIDINHFKMINDTYGHPVGDKVLICLGHILKKNMRNYDIPTRYGGDEFIVVLPHSTQETAAIIGNRISDEFTSQILETYHIEATIAIGISNGSGKTLDEILKESDDRMYKDKIKD